MTAETTVTPAEAPPVAEAELTRHDIFKYSSHVHVGEGAEECEHAHDGKCKDELHFHAWVRLPNPFQHRDISEKARAAQARQVRMMKDPEADAHVILEAELDVISNDASKGLLVEEIIDRDFVADYDSAVKEVMDLDEPDYVPKDDDDETPKLYANIAQDSEEYERQAALPEDERGEDFAELEKTVASYGEAVNAALLKVTAPRREKLAERTLEDLVGIVRRERIESRSKEVYLHTYNSWQWYVCTYIPRKNTLPTERVFKDYSQFKYETPNEVVAALQRAFSDLENRLAGDRAKNS